MRRVYVETVLYHMLECMVSLNPIDIGLFSMCMV